MIFESSKHFCTEKLLKKKIKNIYQFLWNFKITFENLVIFSKLGHRNESPMSHILNLDFKKIPEGPKMRRLKIWKKIASHTEKNLCQSFKTSFGTRITWS